MHSPLKLLKPVLIFVNHEWSIISSPFDSLLLIARSLVKSVCCLNQENQVLWETDETQKATIARECPKNEMHL
jgi:hypothetical protein